jgi:hypothetical protein
MRHSIQGINVDVNSLNKVKALMNEGAHVVMMPIYKTFADSILQIYVNYHFDLELPFMFGNYEDTPRIPFYEYWLCKAGYIYARRSQS